MIAALTACLAGLLVLGIAERRARDRAWRDIPIRIHVNGTRGKSTVTRLIWSALEEAGVPALGKTTGTAPRLLLPGRVEMPLPRRGPANIREQLATLRRARRLRVRAVVLECMAIDPRLQDATERDMVRATIGVITNVRFDHDEVMGGSLDGIGEALARTIPAGGVLVTGRGPWTPRFRARASMLGTRTVDTSPLTDDAAGEPWTAENRALALAVTREVGIDDAVARRGFDRAPADPGAVRRGTLALPTGDVAWTDATAANDPDSLDTLLAIGGSEAPAGAPPRRTLVYHHREDRGARLAAFAGHSAAFGTADRVAISGARPALTLWRDVHRARAGRSTDFVRSDDLAAWVREHAGGTALVFCGNTRGLNVATLIEEAASRD